jgi:ribose-phosphate pyrophosphokinase
MSAASASKNLLLGFPDYLPQGQQLARALAIPYAEVAVHVFPDGERKLRLPESLPEHVIICRSLNDPDHKLIELFLAAATARQLGVKRLTLVAPYLAYMRQDIAFCPGESVSQRIIGQMLAQAFDAVITVDAHLHRIRQLSEAIPCSAAINISAADGMGAFIRQTLPGALLIGPDEESEQWVSNVAKRAQCSYGIGHKERHGDKDVEITLPHHSFSGEEVILLDDVASSGHTLAEAAKQLYEAGATAVHCLVTHALFMDDAEDILEKVGIKQIWSTDSVSHHSNQIQLANSLAETLTSNQLVS